MRLPLRLVADGHEPTDLEVRLDQDATLGELADSLASIVGAPLGATVASRWPVDRRGRAAARSRRVDAHGPRAGSTVQLVQPPDPATSEPVLSPVRLVRADGAVRMLAYGRTRLDDLVIEVAERVEARSVGGSSARVNGAALIGSERLADGDLLATDGTLVTVRVDGPLRPPLDDGPWLAHRPSTVDPDPLVPSPLTLPTPPGAVRLPGFPLLTAAVPLLMGAALWVATRSIASAVFVVFSVVFVVASGLEARREARAEDRFRVREFREDLADADRALAASNDDQRRRTDRVAPTSSSILERLVRPGDGTDPSVWARRRGIHDTALLVRLGVADVVRVGAITRPDSGRRDLRTEADDVAERNSAWFGGVTVDLAATRGLVVVGHDEAPTAVARSVVVQLCSRLGPEELSVLVLAGPDRAALWGWTTWLPHRATSRSEHTLVLVDDVDADRVDAELRKGGQGACTVLWMSATEVGAPAGIGATLAVEDGIGALRVLDPDGVSVTRTDDIELDDLSTDEAEPIARSLAPLRVVEPVEVDGTQDPDAGGRHRLPDRVRLSEVLADRRLLDDAGVLAERWRHPRPGRTTAPVGVVDGGGVLNLDLERDGPHALIAGTTGSGKSELLRTFLTSVALHHGPDRVTFLLVDYKGGAAFAQVAALPHTVGMITDLTADLAVRALTSLRAEVRRREELLAANGVADLDELDRFCDAPPALVVVVDEFATMARELPDFVDGLVDVAQRGRSLGVHLVLATQRPAGVVTDSIRANTSLRLALRVADADDSRDVVDVAAAAELPRDAPGRAIVRVGPSRTATVQVAWAGADPAPGRRVTVGPLGGAPAPGVGTGCTELERAVRTAAEAAALLGADRPRRPWLDPLPTVIGSQALDRSLVERSDGPGRLAIGLVDRPEEQSQRPLVVDLVRDGGVLVTGAGGSGRTTTLATILVALHRQRTETAESYVIEASPGLVGLGRLTSVGDVIAVDDVERVHRLLRRVAADVARRSRDSSSGDRCRTVLALDGIALFEELYERIDRGVAIDLLTRIAREGRSVGVHVVVAAHRRAEVPSPIAATLGTRIHLRCSNEDDALMAGLPPEAAAPDLAPGRCRVGSHVAQIVFTPPTGPEEGDAVPPESVGRAGARLPARVPALPRHVSLASLVRTDMVPWSATLGVHADSLDALSMDLSHHHGLVVGPPRSGRSTALRSAAAALAASTADLRTHWLAARPAPPPPGAPPREVVDALLPDLSGAIGSARAGRPTLVVVDDLPELLDAPAGEHLESELAAVIESSRSWPIRLLVAGEVDAIGRVYSEALSAIRSGRTGLLLGGDPDVHAGILHANVPTRSDLPPAPGRGWRVAPGRSDPVQVAVDDR